MPSPAPVPRGPDPAAPVTPGRPHALRVGSGAALYLGSLIGPGVLLVPALAVRAAGPASVISWAGLLLLSAPLAITFAHLGARMPVAGGVAEYVRAGFGPEAGMVTGGWFLTAVMFGAPAVSLMGGFYVSALTGSGTPVAAGVALGIFAVVLAVNVVGLRLSARLQFVVAVVLTILIAGAVAAALPSRATRHWTPFAPHGLWAIGTAANILIWLFVGWESVAQLAGEFEDPARQLPRAIALAFAVVTVLYAGLAVATVGVSAGGHSTVPLADLMSVGLGEAGRRITTVLAVALTMATMNVYIAAAAKLASALATAGGLPAWLGRDEHLSIPRRPLVVIAAVGAAVLSALLTGVITVDVLVRASSACFIAVYAAATASAIRILSGRARTIAVLAAVPVALVTLFSSWYLLIPVLSGVGFTTIGRRTRRRATPTPA